MAINKVIDRNNNVLIDLTTDTINPSKVLSGTKFHGADGKEYYGLVQPNELDSLKYNFIDYDGTLMYSFTDAEIDSMSELPAGPDHTDENLTFQEWNWTLEGLKNWDRTRIDRPIVGANLITTDEKTYITHLVRNTSTTTKLSFTYVSSSSGYPQVEIDWGDGSAPETQTINSSYSAPSHKYSSTGEYTIVITPKTNADNLQFNGESQVTLYPTSVLIGKFKKFKIWFSSTGNDSYYGAGSWGPSKINIPAETWACYARGLPIKTLVLSRACTSSNNTYYCFAGNVALETISFPETLAELSGGQAFDGDCSLKNIVLPSNTIVNCNFSDSPLRFFVLPVNTSGYTGNSSNMLGNFRGSSVQILEGTPTLPTRFLEPKTGNYSYIETINLPNSLTSIPSNFLRYFSYISIPENVTSISSSAFAYGYGATIDLTKCKNIPTLSSGALPGNSYFKGRILVPATLLDSYKSASNWSNYANMMEGV